MTNQKCVVTLMKQEDVGVTGEQIPFLRVAGTRLLQSSN